MATIKTGAEKILWDLSFLYSGIDDSRIDANIKNFIEIHNRREPAR